jgi:glycosyltransferase involved in cell wall biosynthesis
VQTLHDVIPLVFDDPELEVERGRWRRHAVRYRRADAIVAVSRYSADVGISTLGLDPKRVEVIHHGIDVAFRPGGGRDERSEHLLLVGEYSRRKGYAEAFAVIASLGELGYPHRLWVSGRIAPWVKPAVDAVVAAAPAPARIELLGYVDDLVAQYQRAQVLIMSSRYEGFGFPVLEAMACGTPVVAFANSSLSEVVGDAGILVADGDVSAMTQAVRSLLDDAQRWEDYSARGVERVKQFSWQKSVDAHAELFESFV